MKTTFLKWMILKQMLWTTIWMARTFSKRMILFLTPCSPLRPFPSSSPFTSNDLRVTRDPVNLFPVWLLVLPLLDFAVDYDALRWRGVAEDSPVTPNQAISTLTTIGDN